MGRLTGKVAIITGAARGMGANHARVFAAEGARVVLGDVNENGKAVAEAIGPNAIFQHLDVTQAGSWEELVQRTSETFGAPTVLVNNAAIQVKGLLTEIDESDFRRVLDVDLIGTWLGIKHVAPAMIAAGGGSIINVASIAGLRGHHATGAYVPAKGGVIALTKTAALELGEGKVRVNNMLPGYIDTPMIPFRQLDLREPSLWRHQPLQRIGDPQDISELAVFLAGDGSSFCTGADFVMDGGATVGYNNPLHG